MKRSQETEVRHRAILELTIALLYAYPLTELKMVERFIRDLLAKNLPPAEICICAAIRLVDGRVFRGHRHHDCMRSARERVEHLEAGTWGSAFRHGDQGFITSFDRYVDRVEGLALQVNAGIESARGEYHSTDLFSEDLY